MPVPSAPLRIGELSLDPPVVLAPMAGITDSPFRRLCAEAGQALYVSEMITARGLVENGPKTLAMLRHHEDEQVRSVQLYGSNPAVLREAAVRLRELVGVAHIDLNMGCPVAKIMRNGGGAALPVKRPLFEAVVRATVEGAGGVPVTVKMRKGIDDDRLTYLDAGRIAADAGASAVGLHGRTVAQGYTGQADWEAIARLREAVPSEVPVLGNGDIWAGEDAVRMVERTGCDGVIVGRGCLGRPWLFADLARAFAGEPTLGPPPFGELVPTVLRHLELLLAWHPDELSALLRFRKHLRWYLQGYPVGGELRKQAGLVSDPADVEAVLSAVDPALQVVPEAVRAPRGRTGHTGRIVMPEGWWDDRDEDVEVEEVAAGVLSGG